MFHKVFSFAWIYVTSSFLALILTFCLIFFLYIIYLNSTFSITLLNSLLYSFYSEISLFNLISCSLLIPPFHSSSDSLRKYSRKTNLTVLNLLDGRKSGSVCVTGSSDSFMRSVPVFLLRRAISYGAHVRRAWRQWEECAQSCSRRSRRRGEASYQIAAEKARNRIGDRVYQQNTEVCSLPWFRFQNQSTILCDNNRIWKIQKFPSLIFH